MKYFMKTSTIPRLKCGLKQRGGSLSRLSKDKLLEDEVDLCNSHIFKIWYCYLHKVLRLQRGPQDDA